MGRTYKKNRGAPTAKITAAHLAGLRPRPEPESPLGPWDSSTPFLAVFAFFLLVLPEMRPILGLGTLHGAPHPMGDLLVLLGVVAFFGVFPIAFLQHLYVQSAPIRPSRIKRFASAVIALGAMYFATGAMKPLVGYDQKLLADRGYAEHLSLPRELGSPVEIGKRPGRSPASVAPEGTR